jgi:hypothetical protein
MEEAEEAKVEKVDKEHIKERVVDGDFEIKYLFSSASVIELPGIKARSSQIYMTKSGPFLTIGTHNNDILVYQIKFHEETGTYETTKQANLGNSVHHGPLRAVSVADNDSVFITSSMDSVKVWNTEEKS